MSVPVSKKTVPAHINVSDQEFDSEQAMPAYYSKGGQVYKRILKSQTGFVKPGEIIAIMGPSGSGKTSLLNILAQRQGLSAGCRYGGNITSNSRKVETSDFGKFGAFVQQDDILVETMTPKESLEFSASLRVNLPPEERVIKVQKLIERLGLLGAQNTRVGGMMLKGISGGERKRTSIGYELITDPKLLLLDEPTSGLDSTTAYKIIKLLKKEADRGMAVMCTIHQPSSELFNLFDRVILLHEGHQIYNGSVPEIAPYVQKNGMRFPKYSNPADFIIKMVQRPGSVKRDQTLDDLVRNFDTDLRPRINSELDYAKKEYQGLDARFSVIGRSREVSVGTQFGAIFKRNIMHIIRNPQSASSIFPTAIFMGLLILALYWKASDFSGLNPLDPKDLNLINRKVFDMLALCLLLCANIY